jgi:hypothetical protein
MACFTSGGRNKLPITSVRYATLVDTSLLLLPVGAAYVDRPFDDSIVNTSMTAPGLSVSSKWTAVYEHLGVCMTAKGTGSTSRTLQPLLYLLAFR